MVQLPWRDPTAVAALDKALAERILILDGAMGTMIQGHQLCEAGYRGSRMAGCHHDHPQKGNNDLLVLTQPELIAQIHRAYLEAGADLIETNTFNSTAIAQADYALENEVYELNRSAAALARAECIRMTALTPKRPRFVVGVLGPTNRTASISPDVNNPGFRNVDFETLRVAYREAIRGLLDGGADLLMVETVFDTLNCKAALYACNEYFDDSGWRVPLLVSGTITDASGRTLTGQTPSAFYLSVCHAGLYAVGLNCALGATELRPHLAELASIADTMISAHPNAGLPNAFGGYDESPEAMAATIAEFARAGLLNIVGGCCGTTPAHIAAIAAAVEHLPPRTVSLAKAA